MIASHNTYTYLGSNNTLMNKFSKYWKCQDKTIQEQYKLGVRYFDVRVRQEGNGWRVCHGKADIKLKWVSLDIACRYFQKLDGAIFRLVLETGDDALFRSQIPELKEKYPCLVCAVVKKNWEVLFDKNPGPIIDYCYKIHNIKSVLKDSIKNWASTHNPEITQELIDSQIIYFMDYVR